MAALNEAASALPAYAELFALSNFSFQRGASQPEELVERAHALGYQALALTDLCSVAGVVRAHVQARKLGLHLILGSAFEIAQAPLPVTLVLLAHDLTGWGQLCELITRCRRSADKGSYRCVWNEEAWQDLDHCEALLAMDPGEDSAGLAVIEKLQAVFEDRLWLSASHHLRADDTLRMQQLERWSALTAVPIVATGAVLMHVRSRKPLHDVITAVAMGRPVGECGHALLSNAEAHLRSRRRLARRWSGDAPWAS